MNWDFGFGFGGGAPTGGYGYAPQTFESQFFVTSTLLAGKDVTEGDKIFLPPSALETLARMNVEYPMLFQITNPATGRSSHCGVLEFSAEEGYCYIPQWMMENLLLEEHTIVRIKNVSLPKATFIKFRPQSVDFLEVSNPRALLEVALRKFTCLTRGDIICIPHLRTKFYFEVCAVEPTEAASIIETDCNVDFEEPVGYKESKYGKQEEEAKARLAAKAAAAGNGSNPDGGFTPRDVQRARMTSTPTEVEAAQSKVSAFSGVGARLDGKPVAATATNGTDTSKVNAREAAAAAAAARFANRSDAKNTPETTSTPTPAIKYESRIGDKYSKKRTGFSSFTGSGNRMS